MDAQRYARMEECAKVLRQRYTFLRQATTPGWMPSASHVRAWRRAGLICADNNFDPSRYVEFLFQVGRPYPLVSNLASERSVTAYREMLAEPKSRAVVWRESEWERQATCEMDFFNSRTGAYGWYEGLRIVLEDTLRLSPAARIIFARMCGAPLDAETERRGLQVLQNPLAGPVYRRKFSPLLGMSAVENITRELEAKYVIGH